MQYILIIYLLIGVVIVVKDLTRPNAFNQYLELTGYGPEGLLRFVVMVCMGIILWPMVLEDILHNN